MSYFIRFFHLQILFTIYFVLEFLRLSFDDVWSEEDNTRTPSQENLHRTITKLPRTNQQSHHKRALSAREESTRQRLINQRLYKSLKESNITNINNNIKLFKIRKSRSVDELEIENKSIVSPIKEQDNANFDSKLQIKPMLNKKISFKVI